MDNTTFMNTPRIKKDSEVKTARNTDKQDMLSEDQLGNIPLPPEIVASQLEHLEVRDEAAGASGHHTARVLPEDEAEYPETFVEEGIDEAEEELRTLEAEQKSLEAMDDDSLR